MAETWASLAARWYFNFFPAYRGTGARVTYISGTWNEIRIKLPLNWRTRNYVGTIYGGSIYGAVDPMHMLMLIKLLGPQYIVWDKAAHIQFKKPGRKTLYASFSVSDEELAEIKQELADKPSVDRVYHVALVDEEGVVHAEVRKTIYIKKSGQA